MAATTVRRLTEVVRAERVEALAAELAAAVAALTDSAGWRSMLEVSARFHRYSLNNQLLLWAQGTQRGMTLSRVLSGTLDNDDPVAVRHRCCRRS
jgi:hypothetical protein